MACAELQIKQRSILKTQPSLIDYLIIGSVDIDIIGIDRVSNVQVTIDYIRDTGGISSDPPLSQTFNYDCPQIIIDDIDFYYPDTEPDNILVPITVTFEVDDCTFTSTFIHDLKVEVGGSSTFVDDTPDVIDNSELVVITPVSGCTNPLFLEYNPLATIDDGSCLTSVPLEGCTNPLALNYNPSAALNNGTCIFASGCTNTLAVNYDENAVIDDGNCICGDINILLELSDSTGLTLTQAGDSCDFTIDLDLLLRADCTKIIDYFIRNEDKTILDILNALEVTLDVYKVESTVSGGTITTGTTTGSTTGITTTLVQSEQLWTFDIDAENTKLYLTGDEEDCDTLIKLISTELGFDCTLISDELFKQIWQNFSFQLNQDLIGCDVEFVVSFKNWGFGVNSLLDNIRLTRVCTSEVTECVLVPKQFGLDLVKVVDNKKSWVKTNSPLQREFAFPTRETNYRTYDSRLVLNTKDLDLNLCPVKVIDDDIIAYFNNFEALLDDERLKGLTIDKIREELIDVKNRQYIRKYALYDKIWDLYQTSMNNCATLSKMLGYDNTFEILERINRTWFKLIKQLVPTTAIWDESEYVLKNCVLHAQKHRYKRYNLIESQGEGCETGVQLECGNIENIGCAQEGDNSLFSEICPNGDTFINPCNTLTGQTGVCSTSGGNLLQFIDGNLCPAGYSFDEDLGTCTRTQRFDENTNIYAFYDGTSLDFSSAQAAHEGLLNFFESFQQANPNYKGKLFTIPTDAKRVGNACSSPVSVFDNENWISLSTYPWVGDLNEGTNSTGDNLLLFDSCAPTEFWDQLTILPDGANTTTGAFAGQDENVIVIMIFDESRSRYHGNSAPTGSTGDYGIVPSEVQPTVGWQTDYNYFLNVYPNFKKFSALLYPIVRFGSPASQSFLLHAFSAINGDINGGTGIWDISVNGPLPINQSGTDVVNLDAITLTNPYSGEGLAKYGWSGQFDRNADNVQQVFSSGQFALDLQEFLNPAGVTEFSPIINECEGQIIVTAIGFAKSEDCLTTFGCTFPDALNFDPEAQGDDGSCIFSPYQKCLNMRVSDVEVEFEFDGIEFIEGGETFEGTQDGEVSWGDGSEETFNTLLLAHTYTGGTNDIELCVRDMVSLKIKNNFINSINLTQFDNLLELFIEPDFTVNSGAITFINTSNNILLETIEVTDYTLTNMDFTFNDMLQRIVLSGNNIQGIAALDSLNFLEHIDLSSNGMISSVIETIVTLIHDNRNNIISSAPFLDISNQVVGGGGLPNVATTALITDLTTNFGWTIIT